MDATHATGCRRTLRIQHLYPSTSANTRMVAGTASSMELPKLGDQWSIWLLFALSLAGKIIKASLAQLYALVFFFWILVTAGCYLLHEASPMTLTFNGGLLRSLEGFILGMVLWHCWQSGKRRPLPRWGCVLLVLVVMVVMVQVEWPPELLLPAYLLLIGGVAHAKTGWLVQLKPLGQYSYTLLLVHALVGTVVLGGSEQFLAATP